MNKFNEIQKTGIEWRRFMLLYDHEICSAYVNWRDMQVKHFHNQVDRL